MRGGARTHGPQAIELGAPKERVSHTQSESVPPGVPPSLDPLPESRGGGVHSNKVVERTGSLARFRPRQKNMADSL